MRPVAADRRTGNAAAAGRVKRGYGGIMALATFSLSLVTLALTNLHLSRANNRHAVYWNSSNLQ